MKLFRKNYAEKLTSKLFHIMQISFSIENLNNHSDFELYDSLNGLTLTKVDAWDMWITFLIQNYSNRTYNSQQCLKLWVKLIKKYKFKFNDWVLLNIPYNFHQLLFDSTGDGLQSLIRFYQDRRLTHWRLHAFEFGLNKLLNEQQYVHLEMYFLTQVICEEWAQPLQNNVAFTQYFSNSNQPKVKSLFEAFINFQNKSESGERLFQFLSAYNPQFQLAAKNTPVFFKNLYKAFH